MKSLIAEADGRIIQKGCKLRLRAGRRQRSVSKLMTEI